MVCAICAVRRPKRHCPGVNGEICSICCGTEREVTVTCPLECEYLRDSRQRERPVLSPFKDRPAGEMRISETFIREHEQFLTSLGAILGQAALSTPGAFDRDVWDALEALIRTYRTLESGVYYETRPDTAVAGSLFRRVQERLQEYRIEEQRRLGVTKTSDSEILQGLMFFDRLGREYDNGRPRSRAFIGLLRNLVQSPEQQDPVRDSLIVLP